MNFNELYPKKKEYYHLLMDIKTTAECNVSNFVIDKQKAKLLMRYINKKEKEIKRLEVENRELSEGYNEEFKENARLNNIISNIAVELDILLQSEDFELIVMQLRNIVFRLKGVDK